MEVLKDIECFDVDGTLIDVGARKEGEKTVTFFNPNGNCYETNNIHEGHINAIKLLKEAGKIIIVWSHSGAEYTENLIKALEMTEYVDYVSDKPCRYFDDMKADDWMKQIWLKEGEFLDDCI
ncbi:hypothetical protein N9948_00105 [bacterium]|nr:hypothetical protein [bacterium]